MENQYNAQTDDMFYGPNSPYAGMEPKKKKSNPLPKILIGVITIGLLLGIGIYVFLNYFSKPGDRILMAATNTLSGNQFATAAGKATKLAKEKKFGANVNGSLRAGGETFYINSEFGTDLDAKQISGKGNVTFGGYSFDFGLYMDDSRINLSMPSVLSSKLVYDYTQIPTGMMVNPEGVTGPAFMIDCSIAGTTLNIEATYDSKVWTADQADEMVKAFCDEIETIVAHTIGITNPETTASDLGATGWTDEQYEKLVAAYASRGERMERIYPLSPMQEGMLLEYMMNPETTSYVLLDRFAMSVLPTEEQMRYVLDALAAKHEVFRTSVIYEGVETPCQAIINRKLGLKFVDISEEPDIMAASKRIHEEELHSGFNLQTDPLFRVVVMKTSSDSCHILLCTHHIIVDGWCLPIYLGDFFSLLTETMKGGVQQLPEPEDQGRYEEAIRNMLALDKHIHATI